jgi:hypothetical protein
MERAMGSYHFMQTVSIWVMKESVVLLFDVLKNCSLTAEHSGNSNG